MAQFVKIVKTLYGKTDNEQEVYKFTIESKNGLVLELINYGATVVAIKCPDRYGKIDDITLGFDDLKGYLHQNNHYFGVTVGRVANRILNGQFEIDGLTYKVPVNHPPYCNHGGWKGFDKHIWDYQMNENSVTFSRISEDGEEGFPGNLKIEVTYGLKKNNEIHFDITASTDKATLINILNHSYFNLAGQTDKDILDHVAQITAKKYLQSNIHNGPTGEIIEVKDNVPFDFTTPKTIGCDIKKCPNEGYDHNYCVNSPGDINQLQVRVVDPKSGRGIEVYTTQPGVQLYTANGFDGKLAGKLGIAYPKYGGFCLETQNWPDAIHHENFPNSILRPGETYNHKTIYKLTVI